jgi:hypothetical protein
MYTDKEIDLINVLSKYTILRMNIHITMKIKKQKVVNGYSVTFPL